MFVCVYVCLIIFQKQLCKIKSKNESRIITQRREELESKMKESTEKLNRLEQKIKELTEKRVHWKNNEIYKNKTENQDFEKKVRNY